MKVLIVDDNHELAENLGELLEEEGHEVMLEGDARGALDRVDELCCSVDLALLDIRLGADDGVELARRMKAACPQIRCAFMTAYSSQEHLDRASELGLGPVLGKPIAFGRLLELIGP